MSALRLHQALLRLRMTDGPQPHVDLRRRLVEVLRGAGRHGATFDMMDDDWTAVPAREEGELVAESPQLLLAWCDDADGVSLFLLPLEPAWPGAQLVADARRLCGVGFASGSDVDAAQLGAILRLLAAIGRHTAAQLHAGWRAEIDHVGGPAAVGIATADELARFEGILAPLVLGEATDLVHRIVEVSSIWKAM
jgi:hypothetical protein